MKRSDFRQLFYALVLVAAIPLSAYTKDRTNNPNFVVILAGKPENQWQSGRSVNPVADKPVRVRVASYNVEFGRSTTPEQIGEMFKPYKLDIIGFDEVPDGDWTARVGKVLGMEYCYVGRISSANHKDKYKSILSRTPLEGTEEHLLTSTGRGWNPASVVRAVTQIDGVSFAFYSLHICKSGATDGHAHQLATKVLPKENTDRVIVVGDFNNNIGDAAITTIEGAGFRPTWEDLQIDVSREFTYNAQDSTKNLGVIDHILYNSSAGAKVTDGGIIEMEKPLSDHKPIWAQIVFPRNLKKADGFQAEIDEGVSVFAQTQNITGIITNSRGIDNNYGIIPLPYSIEARDGKPFQINAKTVIVYQGKDRKASAKYLQEQIARSTGMKLAIKKSGHSNVIVLQVEPETVGFTEKDAYTFESNKERITITGKSASGLFYGIQTLFQLLPAGIYSDTPVKDMALSVDALLIKDKPSMSGIRGLHVDIARHFRTKEELEKIIDCMAMHKLNTLHLHATDVQGWRIEIKAYPKLTTVGAIGSKSDPNAPATFLTQKEVKELCAYAADQYVSIIPEIDMPGHMGAAIRAYPELNHPKDVNNKMFAIRGDAMGRDFAKTILTEINELFDPEYIHIGFDEVNLGAKAELYTEAELVDFASEVTTFIKEELRKKPIVWDDVFIQGLHDKDVVVQWWRYGKNYWWRKLKLTVDEELNQRQQPFILSPAYWTYFDMPNVAPEKGGRGWAKPISTAEVYNWEPFVDMLDVNKHARELALGAIACTWSERIITMKDFGDRTFPRLAAYCERLWSGGKTENPSVLNWEDYRDKVLIPYQLDRYDALGVWYWSKDNPELLQNLPDARKKLKDPLLPK